MFCSLRFYLIFTSWPAFMELLVYSPYGILLHLLSPNDLDRNPFSYSIIHTILYTLICPLLFCIPIPIWWLFPSCLWFLLHCWSPACQNACRVHDTVYVARSASCCWHWRASCSSTAWGWSEVWNNIHRGKNTVGTVRTMSGMLLIHRFLQRNEDVGAVVRGMRVVRASSLTVRKRWKGVSVKPIEWSVFLSCWILYSIMEMNIVW